jgi:hypothetical protein
VRFRRDDVGSGKSFADVQLSQGHIEPKVTALVSNFLLLPFAIAGTRNLALLHRRLADRLCEPACVRLLLPPFPTNKLFVEA